MAGGMGFGPGGGVYPGGGAAQAAQQTAGFPGGGSSAGIAALLGIPSAPDPAAQNIMNTLGLPALANGLAANGGNQFSQYAPQAPTSPAGAPAPSLSDVLGGILGTAPSMSDFFSPSSYQAALQSLQAGQKTATGTINNAYDQAVNSQKGIDQIAAQNTAGLQGIMAADQARGQNAVNAAMAAAGQFGQPGGQLAARLADLQGLFGEQQAQQKMMSDQLGAITNYNTTQGESALTGGRANALAALASSVQGATNRINSTETADQQKAQGSFDRAMQQYNAQRSKYISEAQKGVGGAGGKDWARQTMSDWTTQGAGGNQNANDLSQRAQALIAPIPSGTNNTPRTPTYNDAFQNLQTLAQKDPSLGGRGSPEYEILNNWLLNYYGYAKNTLGGGPSQQDLANWLSQQYGQ